MYGILTPAANSVPDTRRGNPMGHNVLSGMEKSVQSSVVERVEGAASEWEEVVGLRLSYHWKAGNLQRRRLHVGLLAVGHVDQHDVDVTGLGRRWRCLVDRGDGRRRHGCRRRGGRQTASLEDGRRGALQRPAAAGAARAPVAVGRHEGGQRRAGRPGTRAGQQWPTSETAHRHRDE